MERSRRILTQRHFGSYAVALGFLFLGLIGWSPAFPGVLNIATGWIYAAGIPIMVVSIIMAYRIGKNEAIFFLLTSVYITSLYLATRSVEHIRFSVMFAPTLLICLKISKRPELVRLIASGMSIFCILAIILSWVGFTYAISGGESVITFLNPDGRENRLFLTTFSNDVFSKIIRVAAIYDEAGAFSFVLCTTVVIRELYGRRRSVSLFLLLGGLITFSVAHLIITATFLFLAAGRRNFWLGLVVVFAIAVSLAGDSRYAFYFNRFSASDSSLMPKGFENRTSQFDNFLSAVQSEPDIILFGSYRCHDRPGRRCMEHGDISSSPWTPIYNGGLWFVLIQLLTHVALAVFALRKDLRFPAVCMSLLLLQRPYFLSLGYGLLIYLILFMLYWRYERRKEFASSARFLPPRLT